MLEVALEHVTEPVRAAFAERIYPASKLATMVEVLVEEGLSPATVLKKARVRLEDVHNPATRVSLNQLVDAILCVIEQSPDPSLAFKTGLRTRISARGMYGYALLCCTNFRQAMDFAVKYQQLAAPTAHFDFREEAGSAVWTIHPIQHPKMTPQLYRFATEMQIGIHISLHRDIMGASFQPREVRLAYVADGSGLSSGAIDCPVYFEQPVNQIMFNAAELDKPPMLGNQATFAYVIGLCDGLLSDMKLRSGITGRIRELLVQDIAQHPTFESITQKLGMSGRTVRRQLQQQNISFRELVDELRLQLAIKYLQRTTMTYEDIAFALGYSDAANFRHAFRRWTKRSPSEYRSGMGSASEQPAPHADAFYANRD